MASRMAERSAADRSCAKTGAARPRISPTRAKREKAVTGLVANIARRIPKVRRQSCYWKGWKRSKTAISEPREGLGERRQTSGGLPRGGLSRPSRGLHPRAAFTRVRPSLPAPSTRSPGHAPVAQLDRASDYGSEG